MTHRLGQSLFVFLAAIALTLPVLEMAGGWIEDPEIDENRRFASFPELAADKDTMRAFPPGFEAWFSDHMGLRGTLVDAYRRINHEWLDSAKSVLTGSDGWLYLLRDTVDYPERLPLPADLCGRNPFTGRQLELWTDALRKNREAVEALGSKYILMIVPNKQTVHDEHLPTRVNCSRGTRRFDQLEAALTVSGGFPLLNLETEFVRLASAGTQLWHLTDTHWDATGAAAGYRVLMNHVEDALGRRLPDPIAKGRIRIDPMRSRGWGLSRMLGSIKEHEERATRFKLRKLKAESLGDAMPEYARGPNRPTERFRNSRGDLPTVLALHDSFFGRRFKTLLAESFRRSDFVWHRGAPRLDRELELIRKLQPDIVIHEMVERNLLHPYFDDN